MGGGLGAASQADPTLPQGACGPAPTTPCSVSPARPACRGYLDSSCFPCDSHLNVEASPHFETASVFQENKYASFGFFFFFFFLGGYFWLGGAVAPSWSQPLPATRWRPPRSRSVPPHPHQYLCPSC